MLPARFLPWLLLLFGVSISYAQEQVPETSGDRVTISGEMEPDQLAGAEDATTLVISRPRKAIDPTILAKFPKLTAFEAEDFPFESDWGDALLKEVATIPDLRKVSFTRTGLTKLKPLAAAKFTHIELAGEDLITDKEYAHVAAMDELEMLVLNRTPIEVPGVKHLKTCPKLTSFALIKDLGATKRLPVIATFPHLESLELTDTGYTDLAVLKNLSSLRRLTLRDCGGRDATKSVGQITQLKELILDGTDVHDGSFDDFVSAMRVAGVKVDDVTRYEKLLRQDEPNDATLLARYIHKQFDFATKNPSMWIEWSSEQLDIPSMDRERTRSVYLLNKALTAEPTELFGFDANEMVFAWSPGQFYKLDRYFTEGKVSSEQYKYGDKDLAWAREAYQGKPARHYPRKGISKFAERFFSIPDQLRFTHQGYWWGMGGHFRSTNSSVPPDSAFYEELPEEQIEGEDCRVLQSSGRSERLYVSKRTGRLKAVLTFMHQGYFAPFFRHPVVAELLGREISSQDEYRAASQNISKEVSETLSRAWAEHVFDSAIPESMTIFDDYREIAPGQYFPFKLVKGDWLHNDKNNQYYDFFRITMTVKNIFLDRSDLSEYWKPLLPKPGDAVQDQRYAISVDYEHDPARTEDEIQEMVRKQLFKYAKSAMLIAERRNGIQRMVGKTAPEFPADRWIGERPELKGTPYMIHCWATWCGPCKNDIPLLKKIAENSTVIGLHPGDTAMDDIEATVTEQEMNYPTVVAPKGSKDLLGYPIKMFPYCIKVDAEGKVLSHGFLRDVLGNANKIKPAPAATGGETVAGNVLGKHVEDGLVDVALGSEDGLEENEVLDVVREGDVIGQTRIVLLRENRSVGKLVSGEIDGITTGDQVRTLP